METVLTYALVGGNQYKVTGCTSIQDDRVVIIPSEYEGYPITSIDQEAFSGKGMQEIIMPDTIVQIGIQAFYECTYLKKVTLSRNLSSIQNYTFYGCSSLTEIDIPESVTSIGSHAFYLCSNLQKVTFREGLTEIQSCAFYENHSLISIEIPSTVTQIGSLAFAGNDSLTNITVKKGNTVYHSNNNCLINTQEKKLIVGCESSIIPSDGSVISIDARAFIGCSKLKRINIPYDIVSIGDEAFSGCQELTTLELWNNISDIGTSVFTGCTKLKEAFYCGSKEKWEFYKSEFNNEYFNNIEVYNSLFDLDFMAFTYDGFHSFLDLNIIRTSEGGRYNANLSPQMKDVATEVSGGDGQYYFGTNYPSQQFQISFAFDSLTDKQLRKLKQVFAGDRISDLIFDEEPYKVYSAKVTSVPTLKYIPFNGQNGQRVYRGEGTVQFTAYWPYAHTPNTTTKISKKFRESGTFEKNGLLISQYDEWLYPTKEQWAPVSGIINTGVANIGENYGDVSAPFVLRYSTITEDLKFTIGSNHIIIRAKEYEANNPDKPGPAFTNFKWDSKTGMVSAKINGAVDEVPISFEGTSCCTIPVGEENTIKIEKWDTNQWVDTGNKPTLEYNYWYY